MATLHAFTTVGVTHNGIIVPQRAYDAGGGGVWGAPVNFPGKLYLRDAIDGVCRGSPAYEDCPNITASATRARFTLKIEVCSPKCFSNDILNIYKWPGYSSWEANVNVRERNEQALPICRWLLAQRIAEAIKRWAQVS